MMMKSQLRTGHGGQRRNALRNRWVFNGDLKIFREDKSSVSSDGRLFQMVGAEWFVKMTLMMMLNWVPIYDPWNLLHILSLLKCRDLSITSLARTPSVGHVLSFVIQHSFFTISGRTQAAPLNTVLSMACLCVNALNLRKLTLNHTWK